MTTSAPDSPPTTPPRNPLRAILLIVGSLVLVGIIAFVIVAVVGNSSRSNASREVTVSDDFSEIVVDTEVADIVVEYGSVTEATVEFVQNDTRRSMTFDAEVTGSTLNVTVESRWQGFWMPFGVTRGPLLTITLPDSREPLDLEVRSDVGDVTLVGDFGAIDVNAEVGDLHLEGSAASVDVETSVGDVTARDYSVDTEFSIMTSTGDATLAFDSAPDSLDVRTDVGDQDVTVPSGSYDVDTDAGVGDVTVDVDTDSDSPNSIRLESSVGDITLRS